MAAAAAAGEFGCSRSPEPESSPGTGRQLLTEVTRAWGVPADAAPWPDGTYRIPEITCAGVALLDVEGDGDLDIYLVCHPPPGNTQAPAPNRLFVQEATGRFVEAPGARGLADPGHGNGAAVGDLDSDGDIDVYVCNFERDALYVGRGDGFFEAAPGNSGIVEDGWSTGAAFLDHDRDGDLDLYVAHYLVDDPSRVCRPTLSEPRDYCGPARFQSQSDALYRNDGGKFTDVSSRSGLTPPRPSLAVACADLTGDGWIDVYVANDRQPNSLLVNRRDGTFADEGMARGVSLGGDGKSEASMGIALGDINGDELLDVFVTNLVDETSTLYVTSGVGLFEDRTTRAGLGATTLASTSWGCGFVDIDHDGDLDLPVLNGRIARAEPDARTPTVGFWKPYVEANQLFLGGEGGRFQDASALVAAFTSPADLDRAAAFGDLDGDGDVDFVTTGLSNRLRIFRNDAPVAGSHWLRVRTMVGRRDALGATLTLTAGGRRQVRVVASSVGYAAASELVAHFGLGAASSVDGLQVAWPDGRREQFAVSRIDATIVVRQGEGSPTSPR